MSNLINNCDFKTSSNRFPDPVKSAVKSYLTVWCDQNLSNRALNASTVLESTTEIGRLFQIYAKNMSALLKNNYLNNHTQPVLGLRQWASQPALKGKIIFRNDNKKDDSCFVEVYGNIFTTYDLETGFMQLIL